MDFILILKIQILTIKRISRYKYKNRLDIFKLS